MTGSSGRQMIQWKLSLKMLALQFAFTDSPAERGVRFGWLFTICKITFEVSGAEEVTRSSIQIGAKAIKESCGTCNAINSVKK